MNEKVNIQSLSEQLSKRHGLSKDSADDFVREFFNLITEGLEKDHLVKIKGLGTFKVIDVEDRESVDVNTKERIVIKGHSKVTFTPEATLKEAINKPFEAFETTILDEATPLEAMTYIPKDDDTLRTIQELYGKATDEEPENVQSDGIMAVIPEEAPKVESQPSDSEPAETLGEAQGPSSDITEPAAEVPAMAESPETLSEMDQLPQPEEESEAVEDSKEESVLLVPETANEPDRIGDGVSNEPDGKDAKPVMISPVVLEPILEDKSTTAQEKAQKGSSKTLKVFSWIILLLILLCGAFVASLYMDDIQGWLNGGEKTTEAVSALQPSKPAAVMETANASTETSNDVKMESTAPVAAAELTPETPKETAATSKPGTAQINPDQIKTSEVKVPATTSSKATSSQPSTAGKTASSSTTQTKKTADAASDTKTASGGTSASTTQKLQEGASYRIDGTLTTHVVKSGETLRSIALKYYGSKSFSGYIAEHNAKIIKNPNNVPAGSKINIPRLVKK